MIKRLLIAGLLLFSGLAHAACSDCDASAGYATVTVNGGADVDEAVEYFVIYLSDLPPSWHTAMSDASDTDGKSIRVSDSTGVTQIACYPVGVNTTTDTGCLLVDAVGMSASADVAYRVYVGMTGATMPAVTDTYGRNAVFSGYAGFYLPGMSTADLTGGGRDLTAVGTPTTDTSAYEGITAAKYNGTSQYHKYEGNLTPTAFPLSIEALSYSADNGNGDRIFSLGQSTSGATFTSLSQSQSSTNLIYKFTTPGGTTSGTSVVVTTWRHLVGTRDVATTGTGKCYVDGTKTSTDNTVNSTDYTYNRLGIAAEIGSSVTSYLNGRVAMAALSSSVRSANYISTINRMWATDIYTAGAWTAAGGAGDTGWILFQTVGQSATAAVDWLTTSNVLIDDATYTYCTVDDSYTTTEYLNLTNPAYPATIPTGQPSYTVQYRVKRYRGNTGASDRVYDVTTQMIDETGTRVGDNLALTGTDWTTAAITSDYTVTGKTIDGGDFDADTGLALRTDGAGAVGTVDPRIVTAWMRVTWTASAGASNTTRGFFALAE